MILFFLYFPGFLPPAAGNVYGNPERRNLERVSSFLTDRSIAFEERPLLDYGGFGSSLYVHIQASGDSPGTFALGLPLAGANFALETALALVEKTKALAEEGRNPVDIIVGFLGDEIAGLPEDLGGRSLTGLAAFCGSLDIIDRKALCYLDMDEPPERIVIHHGTPASIAPLEILKPMTDLFARSGIPYTLGVYFNELYKLGLADGPPALETAWGQEIDGLYLSGGTRISGKRNSPLSAYPGPGEVPKTRGLGAEVLAELLLAYSRVLVFSPENADRHYTIIKVPGKTFYISEMDAVILLLFFGAFFILAALLYSMVFQPFRLARGKLFFLHSWIWLIIIPILALLLKASGALYQGLLFLFKAPFPSPDFRGAGVVVLFTMILFSAISPVLDLIPLPRRANFYGAAAMVLVSLGLFIAVALDITFVPLFLWAFLFTYVGAFIRIPELVFFSALLIPLQSAAACLNIMENGGGKLADLALYAASFSGKAAVSGPGGFGGVIGSWLAAFYWGVIFLPFILLVKRGSSILRLKRKVSRFGYTPRLVLLGAGIILMIFRVSTIPRNGVEKVRRAAGKENTGMEITLTDTAFLESHIMEIRISAPGEVKRFDLVLEAGEDGAVPRIYSAAFPFAEEAQSIRFILGENPPNPLVTEIVFPWELRGYLRVDALYNTWQSGVDSQSDPGIEDYCFRMTKSINLENLPGLGINEYWAM
jgi:hypothetical protein